MQQGEGTTMPGLYDDDDDFDSNGPKALRDALKKAQKDLEAVQKELDAERKTTADLTKQVKTTTLRDALSDAGIDPKYARFAERDEVGADVESVKKWVDENKDVYAFLNTKAPAAPTPGDDDGQEFEGQEDVLDEQFVQQILAGQQAETTGRPSGSNTIENVLAGVDPTQFKTQAELNDFLQKLGAPVLS